MLKSLGTTVLQYKMCGLVRNGKNVSIEEVGVATDTLEPNSTGGRCIYFALIGIDQLKEYLNACSAQGPLSIL